eukprot:1138534-Pelagomonas_calceolata.AAC.3
MALRMHGALSGIGTASSQRAGVLRHLPSAIPARVSVQQQFPIGLCSLLLSSTLEGTGIAPPWHGSVVSMASLAWNRLGGCSVLAADSLGKGAYMSDSKLHAK